MLTKLVAIVKPLFHCHSGVSKPQKTYKKASRGSKQYNTSRREQSFTKNPKKVYLAAERNLPVVSALLLRF